MRNPVVRAALVACVACLSACGGSSTTESPVAKSAPQAMRSAAIAPAATYTDVVQGLYMGFFGRAADVPGLNYWSMVFSDRQLPTTLPGLLAAYPNNDNIKAVVDAFANSAESKGLYVANNASFINAIYLNAYNRNAEAAGREYWSSLLDRGMTSRAVAGLSILSGAQGSDTLLQSKKVQAATIMTSSLADLQPYVYSGDHVNEAARLFFGSITAATDMEAFRADIAAFVASLNRGDEPRLEVVRYIGYHYLQDISNTPLYAANYSYGTGGIVGISNTGKLTYGLTPQTVTWTRDLATGAMTFAAPIVASVSLPATKAFPPALTMLCAAIPVANGSATKSTDVLVARSARQLVEASELAGQTLSVYREDCAVGGSHVASFAFDAAGNGVFASATGVLTLDAKLVTSVLNGQVLLDVSTGKRQTFSAYRYSRSDGSTGYAIVQHSGDHLTAVSDGVLAVWSQE